MTLTQLHELFLKHPKAFTDTRKIKKDGIFFALKGPSFNGNKFAEQALEKGVSFAVIDEKAYAKDKRFILVDNVLETLQKLAIYHRNFSKAKVIGLTGSNGKTTTKELINEVLSKKYKTIATKGNLNNHIGVPLTLLTIKEDTEFAIIEMGANHQGEIAFLSGLCQPDYGYITNFGKAHLEGFGGVEGVIKGKSEFPNCCAAILMGKYFNVSIANIKEALEGYIPENNRSQLIEKNSHKITLDAYNANPTSMEAALESFKTSTTENKVLFLGDMFELGDEAESEHQHIADLALRLQFSEVFLVGENFMKVQTSYKQFESFNNLQSYLEKNQLPPCHILIKGSRGMAMERILDVL